MSIEQGYQPDSKEFDIRNPQETINHYQEVFKSDPDYSKKFPMSLGFLYHAYAEVKDYKNAIKYADKVASLFKNGYISDDKENTQLTSLQSEIENYKRLQKEK